LRDRLGRGDHQQQGRCRNPFIHVGLHWYGIQLIEADSRPPRYTLTAFHLAVRTMRLHRSGALQKAEKP
jgi:hypothetical protein